MTAHRKLLALFGLAGVLTLTACNSGSADKAAATTPKSAPATAAATTPTPKDTTAATTADTAVKDTTAATTAATTADTEPVIEGPAPGVTDTAIKIGVTVVDFEALKAAGLEYKIGEVKTAWQALADDINASGGINGRKLEMSIIPIQPGPPAPAEEACVKLTEDDDVFIFTGFFLGDTVLCPVDVHATAVIGAGITPEGLAQAKAPWISNEADGDVPKAVLAAFSKAGKLGGTVGVFAAAIDQAALDNQILPKLKELGITPAEVGIDDSPPGDQAATQASVKVIAERFKAANVDTIVLVGGSGANWPTNMADDASYRPQLLFTQANAIQSFASNAQTTDTSILKGALVGGLYGPDQAVYDEAEMQKCIAILNKAGVAITPPNPADANDKQYQMAFLSCPQMAILKAWLEAAGKNLNYGTLTAAIDGLKVKVPGDPTERTYGAGSATDGDPAAFLFAWDEATKGVVLSK